MTALPCISHYADQYADVLGQEAARQAYIEMRAVQIEFEMWSNLEYVSDAFGDAASSLSIFKYRPDVLYPNHPLAQRFLELFRDGSDDLEAMRMLRGIGREYIQQRAWDEAEKELDRQP
jgi:hypothetical protein